MKYLLLILLSALPVFGQATNANYADQVKSLLVRADWNVPSIKGHISGECIVTNKERYAYMLSGTDSVVKYMRSTCITNTYAYVVWGDGEKKFLLESKELWATNYVTWE